MNASINHIGLTIGNVDEAIHWYTQVLGYRLIAGPLDLIPDASHFGRMAADLLGDRLRRGRFAHLLSENAIGLELFEFEDPETGVRPDNMEYWKYGYFHICVTDADVTVLAEKIVAQGGKQRSQVWEVFPGSGFYLAYCEDPWGNVIEIYSHSYEQIWSYQP